MKRSLSKTVKIIRYGPDDNYLVFTEDGMILYMDGDHHTIIKKIKLKCKKLISVIEIII